MTGESIIDPDSEDQADALMDKLSKKPFWQRVYDQYGNYSYISTETVEEIIERHERTSKTL